MHQLISSSWSTTRYSHAVRTLCIMIHYANAANIVLASFILHNVITMTQQLIIGAAIFAIGCSSTGSTPSSNVDKSDGPPVPQPTSVISAALSGTKGGTLTIAATADIPHKDVHQEVQETLTTMGPGLAYSRLLRLRSGRGDQPNL